MICSCCTKLEIKLHALRDNGGIKILSQNMNNKTQQSTVSHKTASSKSFHNCHGKSGEFSLQFSGRIFHFFSTNNVFALQKKNGINYLIIL